MEEKIKEFQQIILEDYGIELTNQQAQEDAIAFLEAFKLLVPKNSNLIHNAPVDSQRKGYG